MENRVIKKRALRKKRAMRVRKKLRGNAQRPRMCVVKSNAHIDVQLIDDESGKTLVHVGTLSKRFRKTEFGRKNKTSARKLGEEVAQLAAELSIKEVVFDRGAASYHGILAELADAAREKGLKV